MTGEKITVADGYTLQYGKNDSSGSFIILLDGWRNTTRTFYLSEDLVVFMFLNSLIEEHGEK